MKRAELKQASRMSYLHATVSQLIAWHNGYSRHNAFSGECCPDFSCCHPEMYNKSEESRLMKLNHAIAEREKARVQ
jgi:hypothetical protein